MPLKDYNRLLKSNTTIGFIVTVFDNTDKNTSVRGIRIFDKQEDANNYYLSNIQKFNKELVIFDEIRID